MTSLLQDACKTLFCWCLCVLHRNGLPGSSHGKVGVERALGTTDATPPIHCCAHHPRCRDRFAGPNHAPCFWVGVENQWRRSHSVALLERPWPYLRICMGSNLSLNQVNSTWNCRKSNSRSLIKGILQFLCHPNEHSLYHAFPHCYNGFMLVGSCSLQSQEDSKASY